MKVGVDSMSVKIDKKNNTAYIPCARCGGDTFHDILFCDKSDGSPDYHYVENRMIVQCRGCLNKSFCQIDVDYEASYPTGNDDEWENPEYIDNYPRIKKVESSINNFTYVPEIVETIYKESILAIQENAAILAGLGLRATIEAICNDRGIKGKDLQKRINELQTQGLVSKKDSERLHGIRFMGNDAAHEIKTHKKEQISVALKIVDHLINTLYILEKEVEGLLDTAITEFKEFIELLIKKTKKLEKGDEIPLTGILESDVRRFQGKLAELESKLKDEIQAGNVPFLSLGKIDKHANSTDDKQYYMVVTGKVHLTTTGPLRPKRPTPLATPPKTIKTDQSKDTADNGASHNEKDLEK